MLGSLRRTKSAKSSISENLIVLGVLIGFL
jgi:hypothetical protein